MVLLYSFRNKCMLFLFMRLFWSARLDVWQLLRYNTSMEKWSIKQKKRGYYG